MTHNQQPNSEVREALPFPGMDMEALFRAFAASIQKVVNDSDPLAAWRIQVPEEGIRFWLGYLNQGIEGIKQAAQSTLLAKLGSDEMRDAVAKVLEEKDGPEVPYITAAHQVLQQITNELKE